MKCLYFSYWIILFSSLYPSSFPFPPFLLSCPSSPFLNSFFAFLHPDFSFFPLSCPLVKLWISECMDDSRPQHLPCYAQGSEHSVPLAQAGGGAERNRLAIWRRTYGWCGTHSHNCRRRRSEIERGILTPLNQSQEKEEFERGTNVKGSLFEKEA